MLVAGLIAALVAAVAVAVPARGFAAWVAPTAGEVTRGFSVGPSPFAGGQHRGADFRARPGALVRSACGGRVVVAGRVGSSGRVVTVLCGAWRVTHMPLSEIAVRSGETVRRGERLGTVAAGSGHAGLHLGVRREGRRFGYVDPLRFLAPPTATPPPVVRPPRRVAPDLDSPRRPLPAGSSPAVAGRAVAPWFVWGGLGLLLGGAAGAGVRLAPRRRRFTVPRPAAQEVA